jgi:hypothetical protein
MPQPELLATGLAFHRLVQSYHEHEASLRREYRCQTARSSRARVDLFLWEEGESPVVQLAEIKSTDWDVLWARGTVATNLARHRRQLWRYLDGRVGVERASEDVVIDLSRFDRSAVLVYPVRPSTPGLADHVEAELGEWGIATNWFFEEPTVASPKARRSWEAMLSGRLEEDPRIGPLQPFLARATWTESTKLATSRRAPS